MPAICLTTSSNLQLQIIAIMLHSGCIYFIAVAGYFIVINNQLNVIFRMIFLYFPCVIKAKGQ